jgi:hypothetical protein
VCSSLPNSNCQEPSPIWSEFAAPTEREAAWLPHVIATSIMWQRLLQQLCQHQAHQSVLTHVSRNPARCSAASSVPSTFQAQRTQSDYHCSFESSHQENSHTCSNQQGMQCSLPTPSLYPQGMKYDYFCRCQDGGTFQPLEDRVHMQEHARDAVHASQRRH